MSARLEEAIVLCGGLGTRLRAVVSDVPKPMAPVAGRPFLEYLLRFLRREGVSRAILAVGYKREVIMDHFGTAWGGLRIDYVVEEEPLGTGGGARLGAAALEGPAGLLLNGDSFLARPLTPLAQAMDAQARDAQAGDAQARGEYADIVLTVRPEPDTGRFGVCQVEDGRITGFGPGQPGQPGLINAGVYALRRDLFEDFDLPPRFSFETDLLAAQIGRLRALAVIADEPFIDIGLPESYALAQSFVPGLS